MITSIYAIGRVTGAVGWLVGCAVCLIIAFAVAFSLKANRKMPNALMATAGIALSALVCDVIWYLMYFPGGEYVNRGIAGAYILLLYPSVLALGVTVAWAVNRARIK